MRLFIAIPLPDRVRSQLIDLTQPIEGVRWEEQHKLHLTLKFLGDTDYERARALQDQLESISCPAFTIGLKGLGYFPQGKQPKVLWVGVKKSRPLTSLYKSVEEQCTSMGFEGDDRTFKPHITLGRTNGAPKRDVMSFINQHKQFRLPEVPVAEFVLYESKLDPNGAKHSRLKTFTLEDAE